MRTTTQHLDAEPGEAHPRVGIGVLVVKAGRVLLGERIGAHGAHTWAPPGGHLEFGESVDACARREVLEETGLVIGTLHAGPYTTDVFARERKHYVTLFLTATLADGEPVVREPAKCARWGWYLWSALPAPLFLPLETLRATGFVPPGAL
jgi:8-oxo-dGTP diphosphatase